MDFTEKYCITATSTLPENKTKVIVSNDAYAIGEMITALIEKIEHARLSLMK